jgi:type VI secretion system protein VasD
MYTSHPEAKRSLERKANRITIDLNRTTEGLIIMRNRWLLSSVWISVWILAVSILGCSKPKIPKPQPGIKIAVEGEATPTINRDANGDPLSVVVWIYHLKGKTEFSRLTFDQLNSGRTDQELLGSDFIGRSELVVVPGTTYRDTTELTGGTKYIGVVAFFRKPDPNYWRYLVSVDQLLVAKSRKKDWQGQKLPLCSFKVQDCFMTMNYTKPEFIPGQPENAKPECGGYITYAPTSAPIKPAAATPAPIKPAAVAPTKPSVPTKVTKPLIPHPAIQP